MGVGRGGGWTLQEAKVGEWVGARSRGVGGTSLPPPFPPSSRLPPATKKQVVLGPLAARWIATRWLERRAASEGGQNRFRKTHDPSDRIVIKKMFGPAPSQ